MDILQQAIKHFERGEHEQALPLLQQVMATQPQRVEAQRYLAATLYQLGRTEEALEPARAYTRLRPMDAEGHYWLGQSLRAQGQLEEARQAFRAAVQVDPFHRQAEAELQWLEAAPVPAAATPAARPVAAVPAGIPDFMDPAGPLPAADSAAIPDFTDAPSAIPDFTDAPLGESEAALSVETRSPPSAIRHPPSAMARRPTVSWPVRLIGIAVACSCFALAYGALLPRWTGRQQPPEPEPQSIAQSPAPTFVSQPTLEQPPQEAPATSQPQPRPSLTETQSPAPDQSQSPNAPPVQSGQDAQAGPQDFQSVMAANPNQQTWSEQGYQPGQARGQGFSRVGSALGQNAREQGPGASRGTQGPPASVGSGTGQNQQGPGTNASPGLQGVSGTSGTAPQPEAGSPSSGHEGDGGMVWIKCPGPRATLSLQMAVTCVNGIVHCALHEEDNCPFCGGLDGKPCPVCHSQLGDGKGHIQMPKAAAEGASKMLSSPEIQGLINQLAGSMGGGGGG